MACVPGRPRDWERRRALILLATGAAIVGAGATAQALPCGDTGNTIWTQATEVTQIHQVATDQGYGAGMKYIASGSRLYARNDDGTSSWTIDLGTNLSAPMPIPRRDGSIIVIVAGEDGWVYAREVVGGGALWSRDIRRPTCSADRATAMPAAQLWDYADAAFQTGAGDDLVFIPTRYGCGTTTANTVWALRASDGTVRWKFNATGAYQADYFSEGCSVSYQDNTLFCGSNKPDPDRAQNSAWALNTITGARRWAVDIGSVHARPTLSPYEDKLYLATLGGTVRSLNPVLGTQVWSYTVSADQIERSPFFEFRAPFENYLFVTTQGGRLHALTDHGASASEVWSTDLGGSLVTSLAAVSPDNGKLFVGSQAGRVHQLNLATGTQDAFATVSASSSYDPSLMAEAGEIRRMTASAGQSVKYLCIPWLANGGDKAQVAPCLVDGDCTDVPPPCSRYSCEASTGTCKLMPDPIQDAQPCANTEDTCACFSGDCAAASNGRCQSGACVSNDYSLCGCAAVGDKGCGPGRSCCGPSTCVDVAGSNPAHCGACGKTCAPLEVCRAGTCVRDDRLYGTAHDNGGVIDQWLTASGVSGEAFIFRAPSTPGAGGVVAADSLSSQSSSSWIAEAETSGASTTAVWDGSAAVIRTVLNVFIGFDDTPYVISRLPSSSDYPEIRWPVGRDRVSGMPCGSTSFLCQNLTSYQSADIAVKDGMALAPINGRLLLSNFWYRGRLTLADADHRWAVLKDDPTLYWRLDEATPAGGASVARDLSGNGLDGTYVPACDPGCPANCGGVTSEGQDWSALDINRAMELSDFPFLCSGGQRNGFITRPPHPSLDFSQTGYTVEFWVKPNGMRPQSTMHGTLFSGADPYNPWGAFVFQFTNAGVRVGTDFATSMLLGPEIPAGQWTHVVYAFSRVPPGWAGCAPGLGHGTVWLNGNTQPWRQACQTLAAPWAGLQVGADDPYQPGFDAIFDELAVYPRPLDGVTVGNHFLRSTAPSTGGDADSLPLLQDLYEDGTQCPTSTGTSLCPIDSLAIVKLPSPLPASGFPSGCTRSNGEVGILAHRYCGSVKLDLFDVRCNEFWGKRDPLLPGCPGRTARVDFATAYPLWANPQNQCQLDAAGHYDLATCVFAPDPIQPPLPGSSPALVRRVVSMSTDPLHQDVLLEVETLQDGDTHHQLLTLRTDDWSVHHLRNVNEELQPYSAPVAYDPVPWSSALNGRISAAAFDQVFRRTESGAGGTPVYSSFSMAP